MAMKYRAVGIINDHFLSECYEADNEKEVEQKLKDYGYELYAGRTTIIVTKEENEWQKMFRNIR